MTLIFRTYPNTEQPPPPRNNNMQMLTRVPKRLECEQPAFVLGLNSESEAGRNMLPGIFLPTSSCLC